MSIFSHATFTNLTIAFSSPVYFACLRCRLLFIFELCMYVFQPSSSHLKASELSGEHIVHFMPRSFLFFYNICFVMQDAAIHFCVSICLQSAAFAAASEPE
jgi:hypothetical protein